MKTSFLYPIYQSITFWICVSLFIYFTGNFFFIIFSKTTNDKAFNTQLQIVYSIIDMIKNVIIAFAFMCTDSIVSKKDDDIMLPSNIQLDDFPNSNFKN